MFFSRPPARYELVRRSRFTDVWRRASDEWAFWHVAVPGAGPEEMRQDCRELIRRVPTVNQDTSRIAYALPPQNAVTAVPAVPAAAQQPDKLRPAPEIIAALPDTLVGAVALKMPESPMVMYMPRNLGKDPLALIMATRGSKLPELPPLPL